MTNLTAKECANLADVSVRTIQKKIKAGILSATRENGGNYSIDFSELLRVYPNASNNEHERVGLREQECDAKKIKLLEQEVNFLKKEGELVKSQLVKSENREQDLIDTLKSNTRLLESSKTKRKFLGIF